MLVRDDGSIVGTIGGGCVEAEVWQAAREVMEEEKPRSLTFNLNNNPKYDTGLVCGGTLDIFIEPVLPPALLYIFGAGHVAFNLYKVAMIAGFDVIVVDDRESYANRERFPDAREVIADDFDRVTERLHIPESAYIVIVTRGHRDDMRVLRWAVNLNTRYLGMIGSQRKTISIYKELREGRHPGGEVRQHSRSRRTRDRRGHAGRNRRRHRRRDDRRAPPRHAECGQQGLQLRGQTRFSRRFPGRRGRDHPQRIVANLD